MFCQIHRRYNFCLCRIVAMSADRLSSVSKEAKPESVSLCPLDPAAAPEQELLCIFGTGDLGRSLGQRLLHSGYRVVYGSRRPQSCGPLPQGAQVQHVAQHSTFSLSQCVQPTGCSSNICLNVLICVFCTGDEPRSSDLVSQPDLYLCSQRTI